MRDSVSTPSHMTDAAGFPKLEVQYEGQSFAIAVPSVDDYIARTIASAGTFFERDVLERCRLQVAAHVAANVPFTIVDVGAFCGNHTLYFSSCCHAALVVSFEPVARNFAVLADTIRANNLKNVRAECLALGADAAVATMTVRQAHNLSTAALSRGQSDGDVVRVEPLDRVLGQVAGPVALLKIDVEGGEAEVIRGGLETIRQHRPILCLELATSPLMAAALDALPLLYVVREWTGSTPTFILTPVETRRFIARLCNFGWRLLLRWNLRRWAWYYSRIVHKLLTA